MKAKTVPVPRRSAPKKEEVKKDRTKEAGKKKPSKAAEKKPSKKPVKEESSSSKYSYVEADDEESSQEDLGVLFEFVNTYK